MTAAPAGSAAPADPCRGASFDADRPDARCLSKNEERPSPDPKALALRLLERSPSVKSGGKATFTLEMKNASRVDLPISLYFGCVAFSAEASNEHAKTFDSECGGLCGRGDLFDVTLTPGGVVTKKVSIEAVMRKIAGDDCAEKRLGPLPPGHYTLEVDLPWTDPSPIPGNPQARASRIFRTPLTVEP